MAGKAGRYWSGIMMQGFMGLSILVQRKVTPRWEVYLAWRHDDKKVRQVQVVSGYSPRQKSDYRQRIEDQVKKNSYTAISIEPKSRGVPVRDWNIATS